jgi:glycosyltransferase involved in cell wall biosynthesis
VHWDYWKENPLWRKMLWHILEGFNPKALFAIRREIKDFRPDVLMTLSIENINVASWLAAAMESVPCVHMIYSYFLRCWRGTMYRDGTNCRATCGTCFFSSISKKFLSRYVDGVVAETAFPLNKHISAGYFPRATSHVTPGPIVLPNCHRMQRVSAGPLRVGFIGLHDPAKGIETLAAAAQKVAADTELKIEFLIAGDGPANYTQKLINSFPSTARFTGWIRPADFYPNVDVVVVPSVWHEPFGRVSAEAMSFGVPVVTARSGGLVENIVEGTSGLSFAAGDSVELYRILRRLALDDALVSRLAAGALRRAQRFKVDRVAMDLEKILEETCEKKLSGHAIAAE